MASATVQQLKRALRAAGSPRRAKASRWFFKTGKGEYGEGDRFLGVSVPEQRALAKRFRDLPLRALQTLLRSPYHEERLTALFILVGRYQRTEDKKQRGRLVRFYLRNAQRVNNWDLVDSSAPALLGDWLRDNPRAVLYRLARSRNLWEQRIAVLAAGAFIRDGDFVDTLRLARYFLTHKHDLIHKAVGWMLREVGKRDRAAEERFLRMYAHRMPRTMLRYAIEKFPPRERKRWMQKEKG